MTRSWIVLLVLGSVGLAQAQAQAQAQDGHGLLRPASIEEIWQVFERDCTAALSDPVGFAASHPRTGTQNAPLAVASADGQVTVFYTDVFDPVARQNEFLAGPERTELVCDVHGVLTDDPISAAHSGALDRFDTEVRAFLTARAGTTVEGGKMPSPNAILAQEIPGMPIEALNDWIYSIHTTLAGERRFVYGGIDDGALVFIGHYSLPPGIMSAVSANTVRLGGTPAAPEANALTAQETQAQPAADNAFANAVRANMTLAIELCVRNMPLVDPARSAFQQAGFAYTAEDFGGGEIIHWYGAPANTVNVAITEGQTAPECRVTTTHMGVTEAVAYAGAVGQQRFPGLNFQYGNMENTPPVTAQNMGDRWEFCTGWVGWNGQRPITLAVANDGNDPACIEDGTAQIVIVQ